MEKLFVYFIIILGIIFASCNKNDTGNVPTPDPIPTLPVKGIKISTSVFGRIVGEKDEQISGVLVSGGGVTTSTDINGVFMLSDVMLDQARAYITTSKTGSAFKNK